MYNKVILIGRISVINELRQGQSGNNFVTFSLAVNRNTRQDSNTNNAYFIPCVAFRGTADFINKFLTKGALVMVEGSININDYQDRNGNRNTRFDVIVNSISPLESRARREEIAQRNANNNYQVRNEIPVQTPEEYRQFNQNNSYASDEIPTNPNVPSSIFDDDDWE